MNIRWTAIFLSLLFTVTLCPGGAFAGSSYQAPRPTYRPTFNNASGFKPSGSPTSRTVVKTPAPRTGISANPMAPGGKLTNKFNANAQGKGGKKQNPVVLGGGKVPSPGGNQVQMPSRLTFESKPPPPKLKR